MYNERKDTFSIRDILIQVLCIILFVFLLIWLFPTKSYIKNNGVGVIDENSKQIVDALFNSNIQTMKEAGISYYTTSRLPKKVGDISTITLGKMLEEKLLLEFVDSKGKTCDLENSYVQIVKEKEQYTMKVNLVCSNKSDYILAYLGCYSYCPTGVCEKEVVNNVTTKYKYTKTTEAVCTWSEWSNWSTTVATASETINVEKQWISGNEYCNSYNYAYDYKDVIKKAINKTVPTGTREKKMPVCTDSLYNVLLSDMITCAQNDTPMYKTIKTCPTGYVENSSKTGCISTNSVAAKKTDNSYWGTSKTIIYDESRITTSSTRYTNASVSVGIGSCDGCVYTINYIYDVSNKISKIDYSCTDSTYNKLVGTKCYATTNYTTTQGDPYCDTDLDFVLIKYDGVYVCQDSNSGLKSICPSGTSRDKDGYCYTKATSTTKTTYDISCPAGYSFTDSTKTKCYSSSITSCASYSGTPGYYQYRYQTKTCTEAKTETKYSTSKTDANLIKNGYELVKVENKG